VTACSIAGARGREQRGTRAMEVEEPRSRCPTGPGRHPAGRSRQGCAPHRRRSLSAITDNGRAHRGLPSKFASRRRACRKRHRAVFLTGRFGAAPHVRKAITKAVPHGPAIVEGALLARVGKGLTLRALPAIGP